jgi:hypothetical protein
MAIGAKSGIEQALDIRGIGRSEGSDSRQGVEHFNIRLRPSGRETAPLIGIGSQHN